MPLRWRPRRRRRPVGTVRRRPRTTRAPAASRRAIVNCSPRRRSRSSPPTTASRMRSWRNRTASCAPGSTTRSPSRGRAPDACSTTSAGCAGGGLQHAQLGPPAQARHRLHHVCRDVAGMASTPRRQQPGDFGAAQASAPRPVPPPPGRRRGSACPRWRSVLSNSTVSYGFPRVCGSITSTNALAPAAVHVQHLRHHGNRVRPAAG